jgi:hypothetical protein
MFEKISKLSKVFVFLGAILYVFGFITFNSYMSRFGMVSFDVVNSRFIFAGFFSCLSVGVAIFLGWLGEKYWPLTEIFSISKNPITTRLYRYIGIPFFLFTANNALFLILTLGKSVQRSGNVPITYSHFFKNGDIVGKYLEGVKTGLPGGFDYPVKWALNVFVYALLVGLVFYFFSIRKKNKPPEIKPQISNQPQVLPTKEEVPFVPLPAHKLLRVFDITFVIFLLSMSLYCGSRLLSELVDFSSFNEGFDLTNKNVFVWLLPNVFSVYFFSNKNHGKY